MRLRIRSIPILLSIILIGVAVIGTGAANQDTETVPVKTPEPLPVIGHMSDAQAAKLKPMLREIHELLVQERIQVQALEAELESLRDPIAALELQRRISDLKEGTEIQILQVQATYARREGRPQRATEIDAVVEKLQARRERPRQEQ